MPKSKKASSAWSHDGSGNSDDLSVATDGTEQQTLPSINNNQPSATASLQRPASTVVSNSANNESKGRWDDAAMRELVATYNQTMDSCHQSGIPAPEVGFPEVSVTGSQSAGKSSVLESIVGREFLPRGMGTVTKRPLLLHTVNLRQGQEEYARFIETNPETRVQTYGPKITDFEEVKRQLTNRQGNEIIDDAIVLYIYSPNCLDLTLHDLPGIIRIPIPGQPADVAAVTQHISKKYTEKESTIILAVTAANSEQQESAAQFMALQVDPTGDRTLHVFTKLDMLSPREETIISEYLNNKYNTKYGAVGVVCRSQEDIENNMNVHACLRKESSVLQEKFPNIASQHGTSILRAKIHDILMDQLRTRLPHVSSKMEQKMNAYKRTLKELGDVDKRPRVSQIFEVVHKFSDLFSKTLCGDKIQKSGEIRLVGGAKLVDIFRDKFATPVCSIEKPVLTPEFMEQVKIAIKNGAGAEPGMFASNNTFPHFLAPEIEKMATPIEQCVNEIDDLLKSFIDDVESEMQVEKTRFPLLVGKVIELALSYKAVKFNFTKEQVRNVITTCCTLSYFTFTHLDLDQYYDRSQAMLNEFYQVAPEAPQDNFVSHLMNSLAEFQEQTLEELVAEPHAVRTQRTELERKIEVLSNARERLSQHHGFP